MTARPLETDSAVDLAPVEHLDPFAHLVRVGTPVLPAAVAAAIVDARRPSSAEGVACRVGRAPVLLGVVPLELDDAMLVLGHGGPPAPGGPGEPGESDEPDEGPDLGDAARCDLAHHGLSLLRIRRSLGAGSWTIVDPRRAPGNRRVTAATPVRFTGPLAGHALLGTQADPSGRRVLGVLAPRQGTVTPWGTVLLGESGLGDVVERGAWAAVEPRFDRDREPHEDHRFGWAVEIDPYDASSTPRKHTMLGRLARTALQLQIRSDGRAVVRMGDDERPGRTYVFVSEAAYDPRPHPAARRYNLDLLDRGTVSVLEGGSVDRAVGAAGMDGADGGGVALVSDRESFVAGATLAEVLLDLRGAADAAVAAAGLR